MTTAEETLEATVDALRLKAAAYQNMMNTTNPETGLTPNEAQALLRANTYTKSLKSEDAERCHRTMANVQRPAWVVGGPYA